MPNDIRIAPRRDELVTNDNRMTQRFAEFLEQQTDTVNDLNEKSGVQDALIALSNRQRGKITNLEQEVEDLKEMIFELSARKKPVDDDSKSSDLFAGNRFHNQITLLTNKLNDMEALLASPNKNKFTELSDRLDDIEAEAIHIPAPKIPPTVSNRLDDIEAEAAHIPAPKIPPIVSAVTDEGVSIADHDVLTGNSYITDSTNDNVYRYTTDDYEDEVTEDSNAGYYIAPTSASTGEFGVWILVSGSLTANASVLVGTDEKFETVNALLDALDRISGTNYTMEATLITSFVLEEQILLYGVNFGWLTISSVDATVTVSRDDMTEWLGSVDDSRPAFGGINATMPIINALFDLDATGSALARQDGLFVENGSATVLSGAGFQDFTEVGIYANSGSRIMAEGAICSNCDVYGFFAFKGSSINCQSATANDCGEYGLYVNRASQASANSATFNSCGANAVRIIRGSTCSWEDGTGTDSTDEGLYVLGSTVQCLRADVSDSGKAGIYAHDGSSVGFRDGVATGCGGSFGSLWAFRGATIDADGATVTGSTSTVAAIFCQRASTINFQGGDASGSTGTYGIRCSEVSKVNAHSANAQRGGSPASVDCSVEFGGIIEFDSGTGGTNATVNTISSQGIIFQ